TCVACRTERQKRDLLRIVRAPDGTVMIDRSGRAAGRGGRY
ncbi:MAG TPA: YlxR family protein, partial [Candidatus Limnocylindria bacterium]|nr:YlxR family protein [Candidatus Limnocylindria bacterium]